MDKHIEERIKFLKASVALSDIVGPDELTVTVSDLSALLAKLEAAEIVNSDVIRDANRYRFLRDEDSWGEDSNSWDVETRTGLISSENLMELRLDHFDAAIDARMAASDIPFLNPATLALSAEDSQWKQRADAAEARLLVPDVWIKCSDAKPDPNRQRRVCVFTPSTAVDIRYRLIAARLFDKVCTDATHWHYVNDPVEGGE